METYRNFIGGAWRTAEAGGVYDDENPAVRGSCLARFADSTPADMAAAIGAAAAAFAGWRATPLTERQTVVRRWLELLAAQREEIARIISQENGKTIREARAEITSAIAEADHHVTVAAAVLADRPVSAPPGCAGWTRFEPLGVVGVITPWNFPLNVVGRKAIPALLAGNGVVFKPAPYTPWTAVRVAELFERSGLPAGVFNCVTGGDAALGRALVADARVAAVSFTGSTVVGRQIQAAAAAHLARTQLELGGKNALIVMADADLDRVVEWIMAAAFACAGQWCTSTSRVLAQRAVYAPLLDRLRERCERMRVGDPLAEETELGPVAGAAQFARVVAAIATAEREGARRVTGGPVAGAAGYFVRPTVFAEVAPRMALFREEVFGPVLAVTPVADVEEALALANDSEYGLSSALATRDAAVAERYVREIETGLAHVNLHTGVKWPALPFGGWKQSGAGLPENGTTGLEFFLRTKAVYRAP
jgi:aldehyde dehydrogenase (NAD+)